MLAFASDANAGQIKLSGEKVFELLEASIVEVRNCQEGKIRDLLEALPPFVVAELVQEAGRINKMTGQDEKN
jgi:hypothetical protein